MCNQDILIVDDNPDNVVLVSILLECAGFQVRTAEHALEAIEVLKGWHPRMILMDVQLPGMDGLELTRHLRRDNAFKSTIIIALTANAMKDDADAAREAGCDGYITKPIDTRMFPGLIQQYLDEVVHSSP